MYRPNPTSPKSPSRPSKLETPLQTEEEENNQLEEVRIRISLVVRAERKPSRPTGELGFTKASSPISATRLTELPGPRPQNHRPTPEDNLEAIIDNACTLPYAPRLISTQSNTTRKG